ncbi:hypothetical protein CARUB_v10015157mg [Capsella rubella]|uniref:Defensin-like domain-containing protein n=1 Tax=Capsella rubella TaxID=81985 RepID=R0I682_9BRAS|nr:hypothetical protein CARUB_v10015157mg [Capsella rubella]
MGITKTLVTCFLVIILAVSMSNHNVLVSGKENFSFDNCSTHCSEFYGRDECMRDCIKAGFKKGGDCGSPCIPCPVSCCCQM